MEKKWCASWHDFGIYSFDNKTKQKFLFRKVDILNGTTIKKKMKKDSKRGSCLKKIVSLTFFTHTHKVFYFLKIVKIKI